MPGAQLLEPDEQVGVCLLKEFPGPYDVTFNNPRHPDIITNEKLQSQVEKLGLGNYEKVVAICGRKYVMRIEKAFQGAGVTIKKPLKDLKGIGYMQGWLKSKI